MSSSEGLIDTLVSANPLEQAQRVLARLVAHVNATGGAILLDSASGPVQWIGVNVRRVGEVPAAHDLPAARALGHRAREVGALLTLRSQVLIVVSVLATFATVCGLLRRRRIGACVTFPLYLCTAAGCSALQLLWPEQFWNY